MDVSAEAERAGRRADSSDWMDRAVRVGLVSYGVVHLLLAWLALQLALGNGGGNASSQGALHQMAKSSVGRLSLYVVAAGFVALMVWQFLEAVWGHRDEDGSKRVIKRVTSGAKVVLYGSLALTAFKSATGSSSSNGGTDDLTATLMNAPGGQLLVGLLGVGVLGVAGFLAYRGWKEKFRSKLSAEGKTGQEGRAYIIFGKVGYLAKAVALAIVGVLFLYAAFTHDAKKSGGLDVALHKVLQQPYGAPVLVVIALGFGCYGLFCFAWARHLDR